MFALFTMCLPPLFPVLLRTTGAGFCYNIGRIVSAVGVVAFGIFTTVGNTREALFYSSFLFFPAALLAFKLPKPVERDITESKERAGGAKWEDTTTQRRNEKKGEF